jgi:hypothetical protein
MKEYRRKTDGFRVKLTAKELAEICGADEFEPMADYVARQLAPPAEEPAKPKAK